MSLRTYCHDAVQVVAYCPEDRMAELPDEIVALHRRLNAEIRPLRTLDRWARPYPHGNKILAALDDRGSDLSLWLDTDIVFLAPFSLHDYAIADQLTCAAATSNNWESASIWENIYEACGLPLPDLRINLQRRRKKHTFLPYFNAGMIGYPERLPDGRRFADIWYDLALRIDELETLQGLQRPYLDQMALPPAMFASGLSWKPMSETDQYIMGARVRGKPLPDGVRAFHYRHPGLLAELGLAPVVREIMAPFATEAEMRVLLTDAAWFY